MENLGMGVIYIKVLSIIYAVVFLAHNLYTAVIYCLAKFVFWLHFGIIYIWA
jgi:hypothetical protein